MARGRMINQKISEDLDFNSMTLEAQYLFMRTLPFLDRDGLINGHPILLANKTVPLMPQIGAKANEIIDEWIANELVVRYQDGKNTVLFFTGFADNQSGMRYDREAESDFAPPPGYIRTNSGLTPLDENKQNEDFGNNDGNDGNTSNDNHAPNLQPPLSIGVEKQLRTNSGVSPDQLPYKDQVKVKDQVKGGDHACAHEAVPETEELPPPTAVVAESPTGDPLMDIAWARGHGGKKHLNRRKTALDGMQAKIAQYGLTAAQFTQMVNSHLKRKGTLTLANGDGDAAERELSSAQQFVLSLCETGRRFRAVGGVDLVWQSWTDNDRRKNPSEHQLLQHASQMVEGKFDAAQPPTVMAGVSGELGFSLRQLSGGPMQ